MYRVPVTLIGKLQPLLNGCCRGSLSMKNQAGLSSFMAKQNSIWYTCSAFNKLKRSIKCKSVFSSSLAHTNEIPFGNNQIAKLAEEEEAKHILENVLTPEEQKKMAVLHLEYEVWLSEGSVVPSEMTNVMWLELLRYSSSSNGRKKRLRSWAKREFARQNSIAKKKEKQQAQQAIPKRSLDEPYLNRILQRIESGSWCENNLAHSLIHGPHLVFDMDYKMGNKELSDLMRQLKHAHGANKLVREPFHFHFCNLSPSSDVNWAINRHFSELSSMLYTMTEASYMDCYPPEQLVYLSPNSPNVLHEFKHDDVYIIGGLVDCSNSKPLSYAKAKRNHIRSAKLPLDMYVKWVMGSKTLTMNHMVEILLVVKDTNDWNKALTKLPDRKYKLY